MKVSVIITSYNDFGAGLKNSVDSVLSQSFQDLELIAVDDGSEVPFDRVDKQIKDDRITWLPLERNVGVAAARNRGARASKGEFLAFLDSGDWWEPEKLEIQVPLLERSQETVFVFCGARVHRQGYPPFEMKPRPVQDWVAGLLVSQPIIGSASGVLLRKSSFDEVGGFYEENDIPEDRDLWLRLAMLGKVDFVDSVLTNLNIVEKSRSVDPELKQETYEHFLQRHEKEISERGLLRTARAHYHASIANKFFHANELRPGVRESMKSLQQKFRPKVFFRMLLALFSLGSRVPYLTLLYKLKSLKINFAPRKRKSVYKTRET